MPILAWLGVFLLASLSLWLFGLPQDHPWRDETIRLIVVLCALTMSFLGGMRFGQAIADDSLRGRRIVLVSLLPAVAAWIFTAVEPPYVFALLAMAFAAQGAWDAFAVSSEDVPRWYGRMRTLTTVAAVAALMPALAATA